MIDRVMPSFSAEIGPIEPSRFFAAPSIALPIAKVRAATWTGSDASAAFALIYAHREFDLIP
ncbi:MAG: hypothetical protein ABI728_09960, partial [Betaproteobacteria bacterium]